MAGDVSALPVRVVSVGVVRVACAGGAAPVARAPCTARHTPPNCSEFWSLLDSWCRGGGDGGGRVAVERPGQARGAGWGWGGAPDVIVCVRVSRKEAREARAAREARELRRTRRSARPSHDRPGLVCRFLIRTSSLTRSHARPFACILLLAPCVTREPFFALTALNPTDHS